MSSWSGQTVIEKISDSLLTVGVFALLVVLGVGCERVSLTRNAEAVPTASPSPAETNGDYGSPTKIGELQDRALKESSGLAASRTNPGAYWTHNDSGDGPFIYAFDSVGKKLGVWRVPEARSRDWEDIATGPGPDRSKTYLYIGDTGDDGGRGPALIVYRIPEPQITASDAEATKREPRLTSPAEAIRLQYPDRKHDCEALLVHPRTGDIYLVTKERFARPIVYKAAAPFSAQNVYTLKRIGELTLPGYFSNLITGGDISPDGRRVALCDYLRGYEAVLPNSERNFDAIWQQPLVPLALGKRKQGEAIAYRQDGKALLATSEGVGSPLNQIERR